MNSPSLQKSASAKLVEVPESALLELLKSSGLTLQEFLNSHQGSIKIGRAFLKRANAAKWSRMWLAASTLISLVSFVSEKGSDRVEDGICVVLLATMTCVEFKVREWFLNGDERGARYGYWNQTAFAILFLIYGAYHYHTASVPQWFDDLLGDSDYDAQILQMSKIFYGTIGLAGAMGQYLLALYYRRSLKGR